MADEIRPTVTVTALQLHTYHGATYAVGDTYEADAGDVETIEVQGKGARVVTARTASPPEGPVPTTKTVPPPKAKK